MLLKPAAAIATIAKAFPKLTIIAAHVGGHACYDEVEQHLVGLPNVYFDIAMGHTDASAEQTRRIVKKHGADHILFATDLPWGSPGQTLDFLASLELSDEENELICYKNAQKLLGL